jgi:hypothetical protein
MLLCSISGRIRIFSFQITKLRAVAVQHMEMAGASRPMMPSLSDKAAARDPSPDEVSEHVAIASQSKHQPL